MARTGRARPKRKPPSSVEPAAGAGQAVPPAGGEGAGRREWRRGVRLGVDVGSVRVGLAACDPDGLVATAVATLPRDDPPRPPGARRRRRGTEEGRDPDAVPTDVARIADEVRARGAVEVVVGLPRSLSGQEGRAAGLARTYAARLAEVVAPVPVRLVDERLSTAGAHRSLHEGGTSGRRHRSVVDQVAAAWILQTALDLERGSGQPPGPHVRSAGGPADEGAAEPRGRDQREREKHDDEVGGCTGARRTGEDAERRAKGPPVEEDASVSTGPTAADAPPSRDRGSAPRPGPRPRPSLGRRHRAGHGAVSDAPAPDAPAPDVLAPDVLAPDAPAADVLAPDAPAADVPLPDAPAADLRGER